MKVSEARKILRDYIGTGPDVEPVEFDKAVALGAEALERVEDSRRPDPLYPDKLLPEETPEGE